MQRTYGIYRHFQFSGVPAPTDTDWHWWGKLNAAGRGAVVVIRGSAGPEEQVVNLPWVQPDKNYSVSALFGGNPPLRYSGKELQAGALKLKLPKLGQEILELNW